MTANLHPAPLGRLPRASIATAMMALLACLVPACQRSYVRTAPYRAQPDSVVPGDLRGPFNGQVVEASTGEPIAGALVYATWTTEAGYGGHQPYRFHEFVTNTDAGGLYEIPRLRQRDGRAIHTITDFHLVIYKRGYVAYRSDRRFPDFGVRRDFAQTRNRVALVRWRDDFSHARHLRYIGGGPAIAALTAWEAAEAAAELDRGGVASDGIGTALLPAQRGTYLVAAQLLTAEDIKAITGFDGGFETGPLGDEPDTTSYSSQHLKALGRPESYDIALRLWRLAPQEAEARYQQLAESLPGVEERNEIADRSLRATEAQIYGIAFVDRGRGLVALLTCGQGQCSSADMAARLAEHAFSRVQTLWPQVTPPPADQSKGQDAGGNPPGGSTQGGSGGTQGKGDSQ